MDYSAILFDLGPWNWLILAGLLILLEIAVPGFFLLFLGLAAGTVGVIALTTDIAWQFQLLLFAALAMLSVLYARKFWAGAKTSSDKPLLNRRAKQLVGRSYAVEQPIENGRGKIRVGDTLWAVEGPDLPKGATVTVVETDGMILRVEAKD